MKVFETPDIRNIAIIGHKAAGKTSIAESALWSAKATGRLGSTAAATSSLDFEPEEQKRVMSTATSVASFEWKKTKINLLDTPGDANFLFDTKTVLSAADGALCVVSAKDGVEPMTDRVFQWAKDMGLTRALVVAKMDVETADADRIVADIKEHLCADASLVQFPIGSGASFRGLVDLVGWRALLFEPGDEGRVREAPVPADLEDEARHARDHLIEDIAATDEDLMERFFDETLTAEDIHTGLAKAVRAGTLVPVYFASGTLNHGVTTLFDALVRAMPHPGERRPQPGKRSGADATLAPDPDGPLTCHVFKTIVDQHAGKISVMRVLGGTARSDTALDNPGRPGAPKERLGPLQSLLGKKMTPVDSAPPGDIFAVAKLKDVHTGDTLSADGFVVPTGSMNPPLISRAVHAKDKQQEDKIVAGLARLIEEDPGLTLGRDEQTGEVLLSGTGQQHLEVSIEKMQRKFGVECSLSLPRIAYLETLTAPVSGVEGKHKKQSGGHGQFAVVQLDFEPAERGAGLVFEDAVVGGSVPRAFIPSVEKGLQKAMARGVLAGYPVVDVRARLTDGKHHPVDSSDMAFQVAASKGFKAAAAAAHPVLLEPIMALEVLVPEDHMGDVLGDLSSRRGRIVGSEPRGKLAAIKAQVPLADLQTYEASLRSMTQGRGTFVMCASHMEPVPTHIQQRIVEDSGFVSTDED